MRRGDRVAFALANGPESATAFLTIASSAACAPLNPTYRKQELDFYLADLAPAAIVVPSGGIEQDGAAVQSAREQGVAVFELSVPAGAPAGVFELSGAPVERTGGGEEGGAPSPDDIGLLHRFADVLRQRGKLREAGTSIPGSASSSPRTPRQALSGRCCEGDACPTRRLSRPSS